MKLIGNYSDDIRDLIKGDEQYTIPWDIKFEEYAGFTAFKTVSTDPASDSWFWPEYSSKIKLSVFRSGIFLSQHELEKNTDFYLKNNEYK